MSFELFQAVRGSFPESFVQSAAEQYHENQENVKNLVDAAVPAVLSGILHFEKKEGDTHLMDLCKTAASFKTGDSAAHLIKTESDQAGSFLDTGAEWMHSLFGEKSKALLEHLHSFAHVKQSTASSVLSAITPVALAQIGKHAIKSTTTPAEFASWLHSEKEIIQEHIPASLNLSALGFAGHHAVHAPQPVAEAPKPVSHAAQHREPAGIPPNTGIPPTKSPTNWLWWILGLLILLAILFFVFRGCGNNSMHPIAADSTAVADTAKKQGMASDSIPAALNGKESLKVKLPDGTELDAYKNGIEDKLVTFLNDSTTKGGKTQWFDFDNLNFELNSAKITDSSVKQIGNIAAILKAYPKLKIKIGGYTDKTGKEPANIKLSGERAKAVEAALKGKNASAAQLVGAEGYGSAFAKAAADAPDSVRAKDRRISVDVREK